MRQASGSVRHQAKLSHPTGHVRQVVQTKLAARQELPILSLEDGRWVVQQWLCQEVGSSY